MRKVLAVILPSVLLLCGSSLGATAAEVKKFENPQLGISFEYPANWKLAPAAPRGLFPNEVFNVRVDGDARTSFTVAVYRLDTPVAPENLDATLTHLDWYVQNWISRQPGGQLFEFDDVEVDDADGHEYSFEFTMGGQLMFSNMFIIPHGTNVIEISQWAVDDTYDDKLDIFDDIFSSLTLPWSKP